MSPELTIYYRGPLHSCNYACAYCPFAKTADTAASLAYDAARLRCFVAWVRDQPQHQFRIMFTPWGEALVRRHYREAMVALGHLPQVLRVAAQTNLSFDPGWAADADRDALRLWCTYHPSQVSRAAFLRRCAELDALGVHYCVGMVGLADDVEEIEAMRAALPDTIYLWINAYKREPTPAELRRRFVAVDPFYPINAQEHESFGHACGAGRTSIMVDGDGTMRRCHFVGEPIGNLYEPQWTDALRARRCPNASCGCYIGYVHLERLRLRDRYGDGLMERVLSVADRKTGV